MKVSVIIPALDEAPSIGASVASALEGAHEVIVADGGSSDGTARAAEDLGARVIRAPRGRGAQMDAGAGEAAGDVLLFLHADTVLPGGWARMVEEALADPDTVGGAFTLSIGRRGPGFRLVELLASARARVLGLVYGDQAIFVRADAFFRAGGFRSLALMEDVDCVKRLRAAGGFVITDGRVTTSPRRWTAGGIVRNTFRNWSILSRYLLGASPEDLYARYYGAGADGPDRDGGGRRH